MKMRNLFGLAASLLLLAVVLSSTAVSKPGIADVNKENGFLLLELFTSEGCSSCPRADELLGNIQQLAKDRPIYILAYHIDYWDHQGWRDIFSNAAYTKRQYWYAQKLNAQVYTPQVIVNGKTEFVGSDQSALTNVLQNGFHCDSSKNLNLTGKGNGGKLAVNYVTSETRTNVELLIAIVQKNAVRQIKRGENGGRTLRHVQIVRDLKSFKIGNAQKGTADISLPDGFNETEWEVIGFLQDNKTGEIYAANRLMIFDHSIDRKPKL